MTISAGLGEDRHVAVVAQGTQAAAVRCAAAEPRCDGIKHGCEAAVLRGQGLLGDPQLCPVGPFLGCTGGIIAPLTVRHLVGCITKHPSSMHY
jgi:hypothetical protein